MTPRSYVGLLVSDTLAQRQQIAQELLAGKPVSSAGALTAKASERRVVMPIDFGWVTASGAMFTYNRKYGVTLVQEPIIVNGAVKWSCVVYPAEARPNACGDR